jgi:hypothetical protein
LPLQTLPFMWRRYFRVRLLSANITTVPSPSDWRGDSLKSHNHEVLASNLAHNTGSPYRGLCAISIRS